MRFWRHIIAAILAFLAVGPVEAQDQSLRR